MKLPIYQVDAFAERLFTGNPAAMVPLDTWLPDDLMQKIAAENNLSETAFFVKVNNEYRIRWFTPESEVNLCGHATLATAHVIFEHLGYSGDEIRFHSKSGLLSAFRQENGHIVLDFPSQVLTEILDSSAYAKALGKAPMAVFMSGYPMAVFSEEDDIRKLSPDFQQLGALNIVGLIVTAKGREYDFVSRFFAPGVGIDEDPVTGSAHTILVPYWSKKLGKDKLTAYQCSSRGGILYCEDQGDRVRIGGRSITYMIGEIFV